MSEILLPLLGGLFCIGIAFLALIGVVVLLYINHTRSRKMVAINPNWPTVPGRVTVARVEESVRTRVDDDAFYSPFIEFEYIVEGQVYTGKQAVGRPSNLEAMAKRTLAKFPPGTEVVVYYNLEKPDETRLLMK
jgi:hypothetical protein